MALLLLLLLLLLLSSLLVPAPVQESIFDQLGTRVLDNAWQGYNCSVFAYGQTGSGKSYTMMGTGAVLGRGMDASDYGLIPRLCYFLFQRIQREAARPKHQHRFSVEVTYIEIYNERVRDLFNPSASVSARRDVPCPDLACLTRRAGALQGSLRVREHPKTGVYVEDLSSLAVDSYEEMEWLITHGSKARTVAATSMNETSSRSHAVFTVSTSPAARRRAPTLTRPPVRWPCLADCVPAERSG